jgi:hypothetical protein
MYQQHAIKPKLSLQARFQVGAPGHEYEQEAERVAEQVLAETAPKVGSTPLIRRFSGQSDAQTDAAPASVEHTLSDPGSPLDPTVRRDMERRFAHDFSQVRVHSGPAADQSARDVSANAYTVGHDIAFAAGRYAPATHAGRRLVAHELAHVVQQSGTNATPAAGHLIQRQPEEKTRPQNAPKPAPAAPTPAKAPPSPAPARPTPKAGLNRTLYVIQNDVWTKLPSAVRASAEQELNGLFGFVGASSTEKPFSISIVEAAKLPDQFDFSESVVSVIHGDAAKYVKEAFARQDAQIRRFLAGQNVQKPAAPTAGKDPLDPEKIGFGGGSRTVRTDKDICSPRHGRCREYRRGSRQLPREPRLASAGPNGGVAEQGKGSHQVAGDRQERLVKLAAPGDAGPGAWPCDRARSTPRIPGLGTSRIRSWRGRSLSHWREDDRAVLESRPESVLERIRTREATQGTATVVPTFPQSMRQKPEDFPF